MNGIFSKIAELEADSSDEWDAYSDADSDLPEESEESDNEDSRDKKMDNGRRKRAALS